MKCRYYIWKETEWNLRIRDIKKGQLAAWTFVGVSAPVAQFVGGMAWQTVLLIATLCLGTCWCISRLSLELPRWLGVVECIWIVFVLGGVASWATESWGSGNVYPWVPLILLALGCASALRGLENAARVGSILFWLVALVYVGVFIAGLSAADGVELSCKVGDVDEKLIVVLLIPAVAVIWKDWSGSVPIGALGGVLLFGVLLSVLITSALSLPIAVNAEMPLHKWVQGLSLAGTLRRFEAIVSMALNMGWFSLLAYLVSVAGKLAGAVKEGAYSKGCLGSTVGAGVIVLLLNGIEPRILVLGSVVMWVIAPVTLALMRKKKN